MDQRAWHIVEREWRRTWWMEEEGIKEHIWRWKNNGGCLKVEERLIVEGY